MGDSWLSEKKIFRCRQLQKFRTQPSNLKLSLIIELLFWNYLKDWFIFQKCLSEEISFGVYQVWDYLMNFILWKKISRRVNGIIPVGGDIPEVTFLTRREKTTGCLSIYLWNTTASHGIFHSTCSSEQVDYPLGRSLKI